MLYTLFSLLIGMIILAGVWTALTKYPLSEPWNGLIKIVIIVIALILLLYVLWGVLPGPLVRS
jgi:small-conductance mechanosensitive channel